MEILAVIKENERDRETIIGVGQYELIPDNYLAEVAIVVRDEYQGGFTAETLVENKAIVGLFEKMGFQTEKRREEGVYEMKMLFRKFSEHGREEGL